MTDFRNHHDVKLNPDSIIAVGCSCTYGTGVEAHEAWPAQLEVITGLPVYNFGVPGGSLDSCFRVLNTFLPIIQAKTIVMNKPSINRRELVNSHIKDIYIQIGHWSDNYLDLLDEHEIKLNESRQTYAMMGIANAYKSRLLTVDVGNTDYPIIKDTGTDGLHPGPQWHKEMASHLKQRISL